MENQKHNDQQLPSSDDILDFDVDDIAYARKWAFLCILDWLLIPFLPLNTVWERNIADTWVLAAFLGAIFCGHLAEKLKKNFWVWSILALIPYVKVAVYAYLIFRASRVLKASRDWERNWRKSHES
jgi:hypothetical protein